MQHRVCTRCVMDTSDPFIEFDADGVCNHCRSYEQLARTSLHNDEEGRRMLDGYVARMKAAGAGKEYDCIAGVSGGVDSTYVAYLAKQLGLRVLAVHMDNGWDSELAVKNIENVLKKLDIDLFTYVLDWEEFKDLQLSFLKASVPDAEIPTDHAIGAVIYDLAVKKGISYVLSGNNIVTEGILPNSWTYGVHDWSYIEGIQRQFGRVPLKTFPHFSHLKAKYLKRTKKVQVLQILDYVPYVKEEVMHVLQDELGWKYYGGKHYESVYTRFFQGYILPRKFGIDKRKAHLSTLICSGQINREEALAELLENPYTDRMMAEDREYVVKKLGITEAEFAEIMAAPVKSHRDYPTIINSPLYRTLRGVKRVLRSVVG